MKKSSTIQTTKLLLRQIIQADLPNIYKGLSHPKIIPYYGVSFDSLEATQEQMDWYDQLEKEKTGIWWAICDLASNTFLGAAGFNNLDHLNKKAEIGMWLLPEYWGKGIMKEVFPLICNYAFQELKLHRIEGFVESENQNCKKAMAKLNFQWEGCMHDTEIKNGKFISLDIYALLNSKS